MSPDSFVDRPHRDGGSPLQLLHGAVADLVGLPTWDARIGVGSFLQVEIGPPAPRAPGDRRDHGTYHLWLYGCGWEIRAAGRVVATSDDSREQMASGADIVSGAAVIEVRLTGAAIELALDNGVVVTSSPQRAEGGALEERAVAEDELAEWIVYAPTIGSMTMHADGAVTTGGG